MTITTVAEKGSALSYAELDANFADLDTRTGAGWKDLLSGPLDVSGVPAPNLPVREAFGPSGLRTEYNFDVGDYAFAPPFHINHDVKVGGKAYLHIHWSTNGSNIANVKWEFQVSRALGHNQAYFTAETSYFVTQAGYAGAWRHMISEVSLGDALTLTEPDELILVTVRRVTNGATDNTDKVFGLMVDMHYEANRDTTPNKVPDFYA